MSQTELPTVRFSNVGEVDAAHAAFVTPAREVRVRHPEGGYFFIGYFPENAEGIADELNNLLGAWARLSLDAARKVGE